MRDGKPAVESVSRRWMWSLAATTFAAISGQALAQTQPAAQDRPDPPSAVASNQSVSLIEDTARVVNKPEAPSTPAVDSRTEPAEPPKTEPTADPSRSIRRGRTASALPSTTVSEPIPWYRSAIGATVIVIGAIIVLFLGVRRWMPAVAAADQRMLTVVARAALSPKHTVALVQLPRRFLLVGVGPDSVSVLTEITEPDEAADLAAAILAGKGANQRQFEEVLTREHRGFDMDRTRVPQTVSRPTGGAALGDLLRRVRGLQTPQKTRAAM